MSDLKETYDPIIYGLKEDRDALVKLLDSDAGCLMDVLAMCQNQLQATAVLNESVIKLDKSLAMKLIKKGKYKLILSYNKWFTGLDFEVLKAIFDEVRKDQKITKFPYLADIIDFCHKYWIQWEEFNIAFTTWISLWWDMLIDLGSLFARADKQLKDINHWLLFFSMFRYPQQVYSLVYQEQLRLFPSNFLCKLLSILESNSDRKDFIDQYIHEQKSKSRIPINNIMMGKIRIDALFACLREMIGAEHTDQWLDISEDNCLFVYNILSDIRIYR